MRPFLLLRLSVCNSLHAFAHKVEAFDQTEFFCDSLLSAVFSLVDPHLDLVEQTKIIAHRSVAAARIATSSFLMSSGDSCGRSTLIVSLLSLPVKVNGGL